jgi:hypothetical protein
MESTRAIKQPHFKDYELPTHSDSKSQKDRSPSSNKVNYTGPENMVAEAHFCSHQRAVMDQDVKSENSTPRPVECRLVIPTADGGPNVPVFLPPSSKLMYSVLRYMNVVENNTASNVIWPVVLSKGERANYGDAVKEFKERNGDTQNETGEDWVLVNAPTWIPAPLPIGVAKAAKRAISSMTERLGFTR